MTLRQIFAANIRALRRARGWSQKELAFRSGLHRTYVSSIERGLRNVSLDNIETLVAAFEEDPSNLPKQEPTAPPT